MAERMVDFLSVSGTHAGDGIPISPSVSHASRAGHVFQPERPSRFLYRSRAPVTR
jgi:hypothetical protein